MQMDMVAIQVLMQFVLNPSWLRSLFKKFLVSQYKLHVNSNVI